MQEPSAFTTGSEVAFLQAFADKEEITYEKLLPLVGQEELDKLLHKHIAEEDIYEWKPSHYRRLE